MSKECEHAWLPYHYKPRHYYAGPQAIRIEQGYFLTAIYCPYCEATRDITEPDQSPSTPEVAVNNRPTRAKEK